MNSLYNFISRPQSINKVSFQNMQDIINDNSTNAIIISTLEYIHEKYAIKNTTKIAEESILINNLINDKRFEKIIFIYGKNAYDQSIYNKYYQMHSLGFINSYIYLGGLFEWFLLQDIHGINEFPTNSTPNNGFLEFLPPKNKNFIKL